MSLFGACALVASVFAIGSLVLTLGLVARASLDDACAHRPCVFFSGPTLPTPNVSAFRGPRLTGPSQFPIADAGSEMMREYARTRGICAESMRSRARGRGLQASQ